MADFPALPFFTDAYLGDTQHLTLEEHGAYLKLLFIAWRSPKCALPNDDKRLATMLGIGPKKWKVLRPVMMEFFTESGQQLVQKRLLKERKWVEDKRNQQSRAGKRSALKKKETEATDVPTDVPTGTATGGQLTHTHTHKEDSIPNGMAVGNDLKEKLFGACLDWLTTKTKRKESGLRSKIGGWCKDYGDALVLEGFRAAYSARDGPPVEPIAWITRWLEGNRDETDETRTADRETLARGVASRLAARDAESLAGAGGNADSALPAVPGGNTGGTTGADRGGADEIRQGVGDVRPRDTGERLERHAQGAHDGAMADNRGDCTKLESEVTVQTGEHAARNGHKGQGKAEL